MKYIWLCYKWLDEEKKTGWGGTAACNVFVRVGPGSCVTQKIHTLDTGNMLTITVQCHNNGHTCKGCFRRWSFVS